MTLRLWTWAARRTHVAALGVVLVALNGLHPFIHGTPLDSGCLDALLPYMDAVYAANATEV